MAQLPALKILVVDDMPAVRMILKNMLSELGPVTLVEAEDGDLAWNLIHEAGAAGSPFELVVCDWTMPRMTGADLLRAIRASGDFRTLPFLMVTAQGDLEHLSEAEQAAASGYVVKPFTTDQLAQAIHQALL